MHNQNEIVQSGQGREAADLERDSAILTYMLFAILAAVVIIYAANTI